MLRVGLTGGIGAGKSTVARRLAGHGAVLVDADLLAREVVAPGSEGLAEIVATFGDGVLLPDGGLDRPALGRIVFADEAARGRLNAITHPRIAARTQELFAGAPEDAVVVHDVPLLVENGLGPNYHLVLVVHAPEQERVRRLVDERGMAPEDAVARVRAQADDDARRAAADVWVDNSGGRQDTLDAVDALWEHRLLPFEANVRAHRCAAGTLTVGGGPHLRSGPDGGSGEGPAAMTRLRRRVLRATGLPEDAVQPAAPGRTPGVDIVLSGPEEAERLRLALEQAGFPRCEPEADGDAVVHGSADPAAPWRVRLVLSGGVSRP